MKRLLVVAALAIVLGLAWYRALSSRQRGSESEFPPSPPPGVVAVKVREKAFRDLLKLSGVAEAERIVPVSFKIPGRVKAVLVREGEGVKPGQVMALLDDEAQEAQVRSAKAELGAVKARLEQALSQHSSLERKLEAELESARASVKAALSRLRQAREAAKMEREKAEAQERSAREALKAAEARLSLLKRGAREEEIRTSEARLKATEVALKDAERMEERMRRLLKEGAVPRRAWEEAEAKVEGLRAEVEGLRAHLEMLKRGPREEEIKAAEAEVGGAKAALEAAMASKRAALMASEEVEAAKAQLRMAEANLALALSKEADLEASKEEVSLWRERVKAAKAVLKEALLGLEETRLEAPVEGVVMEKKVEPGQVVSPGMPAVVIGKVGTIVVRCLVSEEELVGIKVGAIAEVEFDALPGRVFVGKVREVLPSAEPETGRFPLKVFLSNEGGALKPGMTAKVRVYLSPPRTSPSIPERAVGRDEGGDFVWVVKGGVARKRRVSLGIKEGRWVEVLSGLEAGELVVVSGLEGLKEGLKVKVMERG